ncbi:DNA mismatch repair protein-like protein [Hapsidospora chrysogenum ATCC 11550]|uniref:DNA mismatch repair protein-like protein n=1 Tax=Hapsidospora chrysogenum (strain ATCC 11550 / CBS 779.69 / DSM 880 / IAM 14645 / JCM 23072 / IMI 49137) TaxID=857340 RepID=A0A086TGR7_HAPC1|nr:DNA mismatch repair protein-like protein [Hapsidospora chrysogenum ATCC 11550]
MPIRQLPDDVVDRLKSSVVITSLNGVALGLLKNALDAGATKVNITVDYSRGNCTVEDNGTGIPPEEFREDGGLGKLHHTSRFPPKDSFYGRNGDFLASLSTLSLLSVSSRHHRHVSHSSVLFHNSKVLARHLPAPPEQCLTSFDHGTRVMVRDLFGSMPVRVKQRASMTSDRIHMDKEWQKLTVDAVAVLLSWDGSSTVSLRESASQREMRLKPPEGVNYALRASRLFSQASLADSTYANSWVPVSAAAERITVKGCISTKPAATRRAQFISLGIVPLTNDFGTNVVYEEINKVFANSSFGVIEERPSEVQGRQTQGEVIGNELRGRKGVERWPMFYFRIRTGGSSVTSVDDILDNRTNDLGTILDLLKAICYGFLKKQHLRPRKVRMSKDELVFSTSKSISRSKRTREPGFTTSRGHHSSRSRSQSATELQPTGYDSPFDGWQRVKVGHAKGPKNTGQHEAAKTMQTEKTNEDCVIGEDGRLLRVPFADVEEEDDGGVVARENSEYFRAPMTEDAKEQSPAGTEAIAPTRELGCTARTSSGLTTRPRREPSEWLKGVLESWDNPVFENATPPIPRTYNESPMPRWGSGLKGFGLTSHHCQAMFESKSIGLGGRISKTALEEAEVIAQVDRKFILAKLPLDGVRSSISDGTSALVMLDQHAVDERCQLEDLMNEYFDWDASNGTAIAKVEPLERPLIFELGAQEGELLRKYQSHLKAWGIQYQVGEKETPRKEAACSVRVDCLPPSILERCRTEPAMLINLVREEVWKLAEGAYPSRTPSSQPDAGNTWVSRFHGCPRGILELLHSRSCRSAVMFNDVLTREECEQMVRRVAKCAFPFQCAHGRPSMAPLVDLGVGGGIGGWTGEDEVVDWKRWLCD